MVCLRCHGLLVSERFDDHDATLSYRRFYGWRCLCCGDIADPLIMRNRSGATPSAVHSGNRAAKCRS